MELRWMTSQDVSVVEAASPLFDDPVRAEWAETFFAQPNHHLCLAFEGEVAVGFVSGVETTQPDKGTEMFLYELAVRDESQQRGIGRALVRALADKARERGCYGMWVLTESDNVAALATYQSAGAADVAPEVMLTWRLDKSHHTFNPPTS